MSFERASMQVLANPAHIVGQELPARPDDPGIDLKEVIAILKRRWPWVLVTTLTVVLIVVAYLVHAKPIYTASAQILVDPPGRRVTDSETAPDALPPDGGIAFAESQLRILESESVLHRVVAAEQLAKDPEFVHKETFRLPGWADSIGKFLGLLPEAAESDDLQALRLLKTRVSTKRAEKGLVLDLLVTSNDRAKAARLANAVAEAYLAEQADARADTAKRAAASFTARLADLRGDVRKAEDAVQRFKFQHNTMVAPNELVPLATSEALVELRELERNVDASRAIYQSFLMRSRQIAEEGTLDRSGARIISRAVPPLKRSWPPGAVLIALALVMGVGCGTALALSRDFFDSRLRTRRQLASASRHPVMAAVPPLAGAALGRRALARLCDDRGRAPPPAAEFLRLRDALRNEKGQAGGTVLVTSSGRKEGKSTVALNLALAAAQDGERALLIDADLGNREISRQLASRLASAQRPARCDAEMIGLTEVLAGACTFEAALVHLSERRLAVLPGGNGPAINARVDRAELVEKIFAKARHFDLVVIDCGGARSERFVRSLAGVSDEILLVARAGRTRSADIDAAIARLGSAAARIRGIVFNAARC